MLLRYNDILWSFSGETPDFVVSWLLLFEWITFDAQVGKASVLILAFFDLSVFLVLYLGLFSHDDGDRYADALIPVAIEL